MDIYAFQAHQVSRPSFVDIVGWLWREAVCLLLGLVRAALHRTVTRPRHLYGLAHDEPRTESGADESYPGELRVMAQQVADDREFGVFGGDLVPHTESMSLADLRAEWEMPPARIPGWLTSWEDELDATARMAPVPADGTETALTGGARALDGGEQS